MLSKSEFQCCVNYNLAMDTRNSSITEAHRDIEISLQNITVLPKNKKLRLIPGTYKKTCTIYFITLKTSRVIIQNVVNECKAISTSFRTNN